MLRLIVAGALMFVVAACGGGAPPAASSNPTHTAPAGGQATPTDGGPPTIPGDTGNGDFKTCTPGWTSTAQNCSIHIGDRLKVNCPPGGTIRYAWGTDTYTADSSVCTAAVHAGLIGVDAGGDVYLQVTAGLEEYTGSERNGVTTQTRGEWLTSFMFVDALTQ